MRRLSAKDWGLRATPPGLAVTEAARQSPEAVLAAVRSSSQGLTTSEAEARLRLAGPNAVRTHHARPWAVLARQFRNALLILLIGGAVVSFFFGEQTDAVIIVVILAASVGLGFVNEYRAERTAEMLHSQISHTAVALRDGRLAEVPVTDLVPGDVVQIRLGQVVPADLRLISVADLECDEGILTGEAASIEKSVARVAPTAALAELSSCALMGTVVHGGSGVGVVVATGARAEFGRIALGLGTRQPDTSFQIGLRRFSMLLLEVAGVLMTAIFLTNLILHRPLLDSLLFSLAIAVGITPQLLPAVVSTSLAAGSRQLARRRVLVKRLVCIEDLGDMDMLVTDKTGTLTEGRITFSRALDTGGGRSARVQLLGLLATEIDGRGGGELGANPLDSALWAAPPDARERTRDFHRLAEVPFDHERRMTSALVESPVEGRLLVTKGAPESVLERCPEVPDGARSLLDHLFSDGSRVVAVATRPAPDLITLHAGDERDLILSGFLVFLDEPKADAAESLRRLGALGVTVKVATGDNAVVAETVCRRLGMVTGGTLTGSDIDRLGEDELADAAQTATVFARVSPEHKARLVRVLRHRGRAVGFLGDGVNDALALHAADIGVSVDTATDVAKDAADVILLEKDLGVLADGVTGGRRIFANTIKYVLMGTSSNFGNMFSAAGASLILAFLPMLPSQILLNNLLYDSSQLTIPTDRVDAEQLEAPSRWDLALIRRFMLTFGPISSVFDFLTFGVVLWVFHAGPELFRTGWFVESLATQTLVVFVIRTRRVPFFRSPPSLPLLAAVLGIVVIGAALPLSPIAALLGFQSPPLALYLVLGGMVVVYLGLTEAGKSLLFARIARSPHPPAPRRRGRQHRLLRRASRFSFAGRLR